LKIAIIADIHGNLHALDAVLKDLEQHDIDRLIVNGDSVNRNPNSHKVLERLQSLTEPKAELVLGNHDDLMCLWENRSDKLPSEWFDDPFWLGTAWVVDQLKNDDWLDLLSTLPMTLSIEDSEAGDVLISHGSPRHYREGYGRYLRDEEISEIAQMHPAHIYIGSHTHRTMTREFGSHRILNTGAVGTPFNGDPRSQYILLTKVDNTWQVEFQAVAYNRKAAIQDFETSGYLTEGGLSARIFYEELCRAKALYGSFWGWTEKRSEQKTFEQWELFVKEFPDRFERPMSMEEAIKMPLTIDEVTNA